MILPVFSLTELFRHEGVLFGVRGVNPEIEAQLQGAKKKVLAAPDLQEKLVA